MHEAKVLADLLFPLRLAKAFHLHAEFNVLPDGEPWKQSQLLEDQDAVGARSLDGFAIDKHLPRSLLMQSRDQVQKSRLAAT